MLTQERNLIPNIHRFITNEYGENYWFNGCARYIMEALGEYKTEPDFGYWFFAGLTGDVLTQVFSYGDYMGECLSACRYRYEGEQYISNVFRLCGYESTYISVEQLKANRDFYLTKLADYIDKGIPVMCVKQYWPPWCVYVGYEEYGKKLLLLTDNLSEPQCVSVDAAIENGMDLGWAFIGKKIRSIELAEVYRNALAAIPQLFSIKNEKFCCGAEAFYAWAAQIENGYYDQIETEAFRKWEMYTSNICNMATNGCCAAQFLKRVKELNPQLHFVDDVIRLYERLAHIWEKDNGKDLESIGAGFNISLEILKDRNARKPIIERLREAGDCLNQVNQIITSRMNKISGGIPMRQHDIVPFPNGAESNGFFAALSSALMPSLGITPDTPFWCSPKGSWCIRCQKNCDLWRRHQEMLYHTLLTVSGAAFTFDYPEDDDVLFHTMPDVRIGWRWDEPFVANLMDFVGLSYERHTDKSVFDMRELLLRSIDNGYTALCANTCSIAENAAWARCWNVVCGYTDDGILVMHHGGKIAMESDAIYSDWIVITGKAERKSTYREVLKRICAVLTDPTHAALEQEIYRDLSNVNEENAIRIAKKIIGINGVPIETRWHAAETFCSADNLLSSLTENTVVKSKLANLFFDRYIANNNNETHGIGWKIWDLLQVKPETGYRPTEDSFVLIQNTEVQDELKRLWKLVFDNDRAVAAEMRKTLDEI